MRRRAATCNSRSTIGRKVIENPIGNRTLASMQAHLPRSSSLNRSYPESSPKLASPKASHVLVAGAFLGLASLAAFFALPALAAPARADLGVGAPPIPGAELLLDGSRQMLDQKWTYWEGPGFKSS